MGWDRGREWDGKGQEMGWKRDREWDGNYKAVPERDTDDKIFANYFIT